MHGTLINIAQLVIYSYVYQEMEDANFCSESQLVPTRYLQNNQFAGSLDALASLPLENLNVANRRFTEMKSIQTSSVITQKTVEPSASISLKPPLIDRHKSSFDDDDSTNKPLVRKANMAPINATVYSVADLQMATGSFNIENLIGEGSLGRVYRAQFNDGRVLAVKKINSSALPNQSTDDFLEVVSNISRLHHPNVTELVGYCSEHGQYLVVYEFLRNGSLHDFLHLSDEYSKPLTWNTRVKIALGTARALE
ncbi:hypothetical protein Taro_041372 [Colocasia esculenta]|uniref:Protein kinase domain-containing protein n=1 Tax=Colocasia esculenta TaxID=4460 RepID=A0A843WLF7_COLES|nr:hypothetical protein [Colocasia esculenta]